MKKVLVAYFSHSGTTRKVAEEIHQEISSDLFEIKEAIPYPQDYNTVLKQAKQEINSGFKPQLTGDIPEIKDYDLIIIGCVIKDSTACLGYTKVFTFTSLGNFTPDGCCLGHVTALDGIDYDASF